MDSNEITVFDGHFYNGGKPAKLKSQEAEHYEAEGSVCAMAAWFVVFAAVVIGGIFYMVVSYGN